MEMEKTADATRQPRPVSRAWFSPSFKMLATVHAAGSSLLSRSFQFIHVQPSIRQVTASEQPRLDQRRKGQECCKKEKGPRLARSNTP
eukprot:scaffold3412_cov124-Isochrysis_galbana.AAC.10